MRVINLVDSIAKVNFGIWNAAIVTAPQLKAEFGIDSEIWFPAESKEDKEQPDFKGCKVVELQSLVTSQVKVLIQEHNLNKADTIIATHGTWRYATIWGAAFAKLGFKWVYTPHGMLEPWSLQQKAFKKKVYMTLRELPAAKKAHAVRAVGSPERDNLVHWFPQAEVIPNGIEMPALVDKKPGDRRDFLFMARLHHKKGIVPLVQAWKQSSLNGQPNFHLHIAGPDDGELQKVLGLIGNKGGNITYHGAVYGSSKARLLQASEFYVLPTQSEGFPTSVVEALGNRLVAIMTDGCNFPEAMEQTFCLRTETSVESIVASLERAAKIDTADLLSRGNDARDFIESNYTLSKVAQLQNALYARLLK